MAEDWHRWGRVQSLWHCPHPGPSHLQQFLRVGQGLSPEDRKDYIWLERYPPILAPPRATLLPPYPALPLGAVSAVYKSRVCCKAEAGLPLFILSQWTFLVTPECSWPSPPRLGEPGCDSPSTHKPAPHTSADLTHYSLCLAGDRLSPCHSFSRLSDWLGLSASIIPQLWSLGCLGIFYSVPTVF